jgi:uncharacterized protein YgiM (DUF1202 family)
MNDSFCFVVNGEAFVKNMHIAFYEKSDGFASKNTRKDRKLLLHKSEIAKITGKVNKQGYALVPLKLYFKDALVKTGKFVVYTDASYTKSDKNLKRGDIICKAGSHVVIVLSNGSAVSAPAPTPTPVTPTTNVEYAIAKTTMTVRTGVGTNHTAIGYVQKGESVKVLEKFSNGWMRISFQGKEGYSSNAGGKYYTLQTVTESSSSGYKVKITASALNVRAGVGTNYKINKVVHKNEVYTVVEEKGGWGRLSTGDGWISLKYTSKV